MYIYWNWIKLVAIDGELLLLYRGSWGIREQINIIISKIKHSTYHWIQSLKLFVKFNSNSSLISKMAVLT
ncbi:hypothetical protein NMY3_03691 [Candidatus Nitrosocosmicus oleophilus]|uniref:Uncharacterized protein n=1 Tax=Candidatus Nitrosocosmicus oleophilus TaxID=1353260 RepID=A0A654M4Z1_9ARCH|nr:hypothetical protein NMY3_03691 [Candidatus Nitrosocosmicus oleophilus]